MAESTGYALCFFLFVSVKNGKYKKALKYDKKSLKFDKYISFLLRV